MTRLPARGTAIAAPLKNEAELKRALSALQVGEMFDANSIAELYSKLGIIIGLWLSEQSRIEVSQVAKALLATANNLRDISRLLSGLDEGLRNSLEIAVASEAIKYLALDPTVGSRSKARALVSAFQRDASRIAHVCLVAHTALNDQAGPPGRPALEWYDKFTAVLLEIAAKADVKPTQRKGRIDQVRSGWLFDAAQALEPFLYRAMRSPSAEACGKRLERSQAALRKANRQKQRAH
jgi:hypothetical protein